MMQGHLLLVGKDLVFLECCAAFDVVGNPLIYAVPLNILPGLANGLVSA